MINVQELNEKVKAIGLDKIGFIAEDINGDGWDNYVGADRGEGFGFDAETCSFRADTGLYWDSYEIRESTLEGMYDIVLIGSGPAYTTV